MLNDVVKISILMKKNEYHSPQLVHYGAVRNLTKAGTGLTSENSGSDKCTGNDLGKKCSERHIKENIVRVGNHARGFGLYLFDYKPEFRAMMGYGRHFGVMIDEVEPIMPEAVFSHSDGFKRVDYAMLGIEHSIH